MAALGKFRFSLARVLGVREIEKRLAAARVSEANARLREAESVRREAERACGLLEDELRALRGAPRIDVAACLSLEALLAAARASLARAAEQVRLRDAERMAAVEAHAEAHRKVETLTRLRTAREEAHAQERRRSESKSMDEAAANRVPAFTRWDGVPAQPLLPHPTP